MAPAVIIDAFTLFVLAIFVIYGGRRGLFRSVIGFVGVAVALVGAGYLANAWIAPVTANLKPVIQEHIEEKLDRAIQEDSTAQAAESYSLTELLELLGLDREIQDTLHQQVQSQVETAEEDLISIVVNDVAETVAYGILYLLSFSVLILAVKLISSLLHPILKLPILSATNEAGGMLVGAMEGILILFLAVWVLRHLGVSFQTDVVSQTHIFRFFTTMTPLRELSFLR